MGKKNREKFTAPTGAVLVDGEYLKVENDQVVLYQEVSQGGVPPLPYGAELTPRATFELKITGSGTLPEIAGQLGQLGTQQAYPFLMPQIPMMPAEAGYPWMPQVDSYEDTDTAEFDLPTPPTEPIPLPTDSWSLSSEGTLAAEDDEVFRPERRSPKRTSRKIVLGTAALVAALVSGPTFQASQSGPKAVEACGNANVLTLWSDIPCFTGQFLEAFSPNNILNFIPPETK